MKIIIRPEVPADYSGITTVTDRAFKQPNEGRLIEKLRVHPDYARALSLVAESRGAIVGHILFFPIHIRGGAGLHPSLALAPMSVLPEFQNQGIGSRLVNTGLEICRSRGDRSVIVLGHKKYYPRFGFSAASQWRIRCPFPSAEESFMALELVPAGLAGVEGLVEYPAEFSEVG